MKLVWIFCYLFLLRCTNGTAEGNLDKAQSVDVRGIRPNQKVILFKSLIEENCVQHLDGKRAPCEAKQRSCAFRLANSCTCLVSNVYSCLLRAISESPFKGTIVILCVVGQLFVYLSGIRGLTSNRKRNKSDWLVRSRKGSLCVRCLLHEPGPSVFTCDNCQAFKSVSLSTFYLTLARNNH